MARVELSAAAVADLDRMIRTHSLPSNTKARLKRDLRALRRFPLMGPTLEGRWSGFRFLPGPWRWMLVIYTYDEDEDRVVVVTLQDARMSSAATAGS